MFLQRNRLTKSPPLQLGKQVAAISLTPMFSLFLPFWQLFNKTANAQIFMPLAFPRPFSPLSPSENVLIRNVSTIYQKPNKQNNECVSFFFFKKKNGYLNRSLVENYEQGQIMISHCGIVQFSLARPWAIIIIRILLEKPRWNFKVSKWCMMEADKQLMEQVNGNLVSG